MGCITNDDRDAAYAVSIEYARAVIGSGDGYLNPNAKLGQLSDWEWNKLANNLVSGWICERSRQLTAERFFNEESFLTVGENPEPQELGIAASILPQLGGFCERLGLTEKPITDWSKQEIQLFIVATVQLMDMANMARKERPDEFITPEAQDAADMLMAG